MDYPIGIDYDYLDLEEWDLIRTKVGAASLEKSFRDHILFIWCIPFVIFDVISNVLVLWIWLSVKTKFSDAVYMFRALALADLFFAFNYPLGRFYRFHNFHIQAFFQIFSYAHRTISLHITLMLAIARFIKLYYPLHVQRMLSHSRLLSGTMIIVFSNVSVLALLTSTWTTMPKKYRKWVIFAVRRVISLILPVVAQNVLMLMVVFKLRRFSKTVAPSGDLQVLQLPVQGQTMSEHENQVQPAYKSETSPALQTGHLHSFEHRATACDAGPQDPLTPVAREETAQSDQTAEELLKMKQRGVDCEAEPKTIQEEDPLPKTEPQSVKQRQSMQGLESGQCEDRRIALQTMSGPKKRQPDMDSGIIYVVLAICASTFVSQPLCAIVRGIHYTSKLLKTPHLSFSCDIVVLINHGINGVFYLFISSFRQTLLSKCSRLFDLVKSYSSISLKATYPPGCESTVLDSSREIQSPITSEQEPSSSKNSAGQDG